MFFSLGCARLLLVFSRCLTQMSHDVETSVSNLYCISVLCLNWTQEPSLLEIHLERELVEPQSQLWLLKFICLLSYFFPPPRLSKAFNFLFLYAGAGLGFVVRSGGRVGTMVVHIHVFVPQNPFGLYQLYVQNMYILIRHYRSYDARRRRWEGGKWKKKNEKRQKSFFWNTKTLNLSEHSRVSVCAPLLHPPLPHPPTPPFAILFLHLLLPSINL